MGDVRSLGASRHCDALFQRPAGTTAGRAIAVLRSSGVVAPMMLPGAMNTEALLAWVHSVLISTLMPGDIFIWDNLRIHKDPAVAAALTDAGARLELLPLYSPAFNPIEEAWKRTGVTQPAKTPASYADVLAAPQHQIAEVIEGELHLHPRPALPHAAAASALGEELGPST